MKCTQYCYFCIIISFYSFVFFSGAMQLPLFFDAPLWRTMYRHNSNTPPRSTRHQYYGFSYEIKPNEKWLGVEEMMRKVISCHRITSFPWKTYLMHIMQDCEKKIGSREWDPLLLADADDFTADETGFICEWASAIRDQMECFDKATVVVGRFCRRYIIPYYSLRHYRHGTLIVRNRKAGMIDQRLSFRFRPSHPYWSVAFDGIFEKDREEGDGTFILYLGKMDMTYEVIRMYCSLTQLRFLEDQQKVLEEYLYSGARDYDSFYKRIHMCSSLFDMWFDPFQSIVEAIMMRYIDMTLYNKGVTSLRRLELFLTKNPHLSRYIWCTNFSSEKKRRCLGVAMDISIKQLGGFVKSETHEQLMEWINKKKQPTVSKYDKLPPHLWHEISLARQKLERAKRGNGYYISSDEINACERNLVDAWKRADQWIGKNKVWLLISSLPGNRRQTRRTRIQYCDK